MVNCVIYPAEGETVESLWRRFRKATDRADVLKNYARSREFASEVSKARYEEFESPCASSEVRQCLTLRVLRPS